MRILADEQFNELNEHIKQLEAENQYLKKLLNDAGIPYDKTDNAPDPDDEPWRVKRFCSFFLSL